MKFFINYIKFFCVIALKYISKKKYTFSTHKEKWGPNTSI